MRYRSYRTPFVGQKRPDAIFKAESTDSHAIREALASTRDFDTVLGKFSFDGAGDAVYNPIMLIVQDGEFKVFE